MRNDGPRYDAHEMLVLASWRYAVLFSLGVTTSLLLFAALWIWLRDGRFHDLDAFVFAWVFMNVVMIPAIKWDNSRR